MTWKKLLNKDRRRASTSPGDHRQEFERDFDRAIFSTPVKRLQDKSQVFPLEPNDSVRTRLTHSLEVSSVARGLATKTAQWLQKEKPSEFETSMDRSLEAIAATCGLIHDLGNPPFGHAGEIAIRDWFQKNKQPGWLATLLGKNEALIGDFNNFEGNAQTLRLIATLQVLADFKGLNFTYGTLSASCKYLAASDKIDKKNHAFKKVGYFTSEAEIIQEIREKTGTGEARNPITFLVEAADDIVYSVADIEDAVKKEVISWEPIAIEIEKSGELAKEALGGMRRILKDADNPPQDTYASAFRTAAISIMVTAAVDEYKEHYDEIMTGSYPKELLEGSKAGELIACLKKIGREHIYSTLSTLKLEIMGRKIIHDLMDIFWEGAESFPTEEAPKTSNFKGKAGALLSKNYRDVFQRHSLSSQKLPENYYRLQLVTDYICGMTDTFAKRLHAELTNG